MGVGGGAASGTGRMGGAEGEELGVGDDPTLSVWGLTQCRGQSSEGEHPWCASGARSSGGILSKPHTHSRQLAGPAPVKGYSVDDVLPHTRQHGNKNKKAKIKNMD